MLFHPLEQKVREGFCWYDQGKRLDEKTLHPSESEDGIRSFQDQQQLVAQLLGGGRQTAGRSVPVIPISSCRGSFYVPVQGGSTSPLLICFHGTGACAVDYWEQSLFRLSDAGYRVLMVEYECCIDSKVPISKSNIDESVSRCLKQFFNQFDTLNLSEGIILYGHSLGAVIMLQALDALLRDNVLPTPSGVVFDAGFFSVASQALQENSYGKIPYLDQVASVLGYGWNVKSAIENFAKLTRRMPISFLQILREGPTGTGDAKISTEEQERVSVVAREAFPARFTVCKFPLLHSDHPPYEKIENWLKEIPRIPCKK